jgi:hypothetical protein
MYLPYKKDLYWSIIEGAMRNWMKAVSKTFEDLEIENIYYLGTIIHINGFKKS